MNDLKKNKKKRIPCKLSQKKKRSDIAHAKLYFNIQGATGLFNKYSNIYNGSLLNSLVTHYIIKTLVASKPN